MSDLRRVPRPEKLKIAQAVHGRLTEHVTKHPEDKQSLEQITTDVSTAVTLLDTHVSGKDVADATRLALITRADEDDDEVDTLMRLIEGYLYIWARRRTGTLKARAEATHQAAFPNGLGHINDRVADENEHCRTAIRTLKTPEHAETLVAIRFPATWLDEFEAAVIKSDASNDALEAARGTVSSHVGQGRDAELEWVDTMLRLRHQLAGRVKRGDAVKRRENAYILEPLTNVIKRLRTEAATRATRREANEGTGQEGSQATGDTTSGGEPGDDTKTG